MGNLFAQQIQISSDLIEDKLKQYQRANRSLPLFLHIDKTVYTNNESIWFSAYLLNFGSDTVEHNVLSIALADMVTKKVILTEKYKMRNALSFGALTLPDTIPSGNYQLIAFTNLIDANKIPVAKFSTNISIKSITRQDFTSAIYLIDSTAKNGLLRAKIAVNFKEEPKSKITPVVEYTYGKKTLQAITQNKHDFFLSIPEVNLFNSNPVLQAKIKLNKQIQYLTINLPRVQKKEITVRFFPEGGNLSYDLPNVIAWEAQIDNQIPIAVKAILYQNEKPIDTVETNSYGAGKFKLKPTQNSIYTLKTIPGNYIKSDSTYHLPKPIESTLVLNLPNAITDDTLQVNLFTKTKKSVQILIKNRDGIYANFQAKTTALGNSLKIPLFQLPKGICTITVFDSGKPIAERLFFARYNDRLDVKVEVNKLSYTKKDSVNVKIRLTDKYGKPATGLFSAAVIQQNRLNSSFADIENYVYLQHDLGNLPKDPSGKDFLNPEYLEYMLLIKGWRKYTWQDIIDNKTDTLKNYLTPQITGVVKYGNGKSVKEPIQLIALGAKNTGLITTDNNGAFTLQNEHLFAYEGKMITLMVSGKNNINYKIDVEDPFLTIGNNLSENSKNYIPTKSITNSSTSSDMMLKGLENNYNLQEVTIKAKNTDGSMFAFKGEPGTNDCGDFVDEAGHFNYEKATKRFKPKPNTLYVIRTDLNDSWFTVKPYYYIGCPEHEKTVLKIGGIYGERIFYGVSNQTEEIQYLSTLFWKPGIITDKNGNAELNFKTSDIADNFKIIIQGITENNVFSGIRSFIVK
ncbi:hypothetical protein [Pedobacter jamesrossensis]|uniref:MG2 domain-containing protein n=1 Tax=Pedobacter jamesrossensis TaxID=1908238 RepID=A0ABV8NM80_9SPHI